MAKARASIFDDAEEPPPGTARPADLGLAGLDLSGFAPRAAPDPRAPAAAAVRAVAEAARFRSREPVPPAPPTPAETVGSGGPVASAEPRPESARESPPEARPEAHRPPRRYRTGRNVQFNVKVSQATIDAFYAIADGQGWVLGETLEHALAALRRELGAPPFK